MDSYFWSSTLLPGCWNFSQRECQSCSPLSWDWSFQQLQGSGLSLMDWLLLQPNYWDLWLSSTWRRYPFCNKKMMAWQIAILELDPVILPCLRVSMYYIRLGHLVASRWIVGEQLGKRDMKKVGKKILISAFVMTCNIRTRCFKLRICFLLVELITKILSSIE